jgi:ketosteroid isomerase-like protein
VGERAVTEPGDNVELVRSIYDCWARRADGREHFDPEIEWSLPHPGGQVRGAERVGDFLRDFIAAWSEHDIDLEEVRALDAERVVVLFTERARGRESGIETVARPAAVWTVRDGKAVRFEGFGDREEALKRPGAD